MVIGDDRVRELWFYLDPYATQAIMAGGSMAAPPPRA
jgi:hypothetical protein